jgi:hypothetical protein
MLVARRGKTLAICDKLYQIPHADIAGLTVTLANCTRSEGLNHNRFYPVLLGTPNRSI